MERVCASFDSKRLGSGSIWWLGGRQLRSGNDGGGDGSGGDSDGDDGDDAHDDVSGVGMLQR